MRRLASITYRNYVTYIRPTAVLLPLLALTQPSLQSQTRPAAPTFKSSGRPLDQPRPLSQPRPSADDVHRWSDRKFGMFIHFGLYSTLGGVWHGKQIDNGYSEQIVANAPIPMGEYAALSSQFNPVRFDPDAIVALAKAAGMKFIVITSKHHDGFSMFHTSQTGFNIVDATPYKRDVVKQLSEACARGGISFGVYYSTIDWHQPGASTYIPSNSNPIPAAHENFNVAQIRELLSSYGPISEIWFDMGKPTPAQSRRFTQTVHRLQPKTMVSGRVFNYEGDFTVMGDNQVPEFQIDEPWQTPASIFPETWGYRSWQKRDDIEGKIHENILRLAQVVSRGGNYILNIGPEGDGSVLPYEADVLRGVGAWLKTRGEAIYTTTAQPFRQLDFGYATVGHGKLYLFVKDMPADGVLRLPGLRNQHLGKAYVLGDPSRTAFSVTQDKEGASVQIEKSALAGDEFLPVIVVPFSGRLSVIPPSIAPAADGNFVLLPESADHFWNYNGAGYEAPPTLYKLRWLVHAPPGAYRTEVDVDTLQIGQGIDLVVNGIRTPLNVKDDATGTVTIMQIVRLPAADLDSGTPASIEITPREPFKKGTPLPVKVTSVRLLPQK